MKYLISLVAILVFSLSAYSQNSYKIAAANQNGVLLDTLVAADTSIYVLPRNITSVGQLTWEYQVVDTTGGFGVTGTYLVQKRISSSAAWGAHSNGNLPTSKVSTATGTAAGVVFATVTNTDAYQYRFVAINAGVGKNHSNRVYAYWLPNALPLSND